MLSSALSLMLVANDASRPLYHPTTDEVAAAYRCADAVSRDAAALRAVGKGLELVVVSSSDHTAGLAASASAATSS